MPRRRMVRGPASVPLINAALLAPLVAVRPRERDVWHAATMTAVIRAWDGTHPLVTACGLSGVRLLQMPWVRDEATGLSDIGPVPWPPRLAELRPIERCRKCWEETGKRRPRSIVRKGTP